MRFKKKTYIIIFLVFANIAVLRSQPPDITASATQGCDSLKVKFSLINVDTDTISSINWDFGNNAFSNLIDPDSVLYENTSDIHADYGIRVTINGNTNAVVKPDFISVYRTVSANFVCLDTISAADRITKVCYNIDQQYDPFATYLFEWQFEGIGTLNDIRPVVNYPVDLDTVSVRLTLSDQTHGCTDTRMKSILLSPEILIQNVFTPNGDNVNDFFLVKSAVPLRIQIFTRSGLKVFQSEGTEIIWYGETNTGTELNEGIYYYVLKALVNDPDGKFSKAGCIYIYK